MRLNPSVERAFGVRGVPAPGVIFKKILRVVGIAAAMAVGVFAWAIWITERESDAYMRVIRGVDEQLGFRYGTPYEDGSEVFVITEVTPGGIMEKSGLQVGDYPECSITSLYQRLALGQGRKVSLPVARSGTVMTLEIMVPVLKLPDDPTQLHWYF